MTTGVKLYNTYKYRLEHMQKEPSDTTITTDGGDITLTTMSRC